MTLFDLAPIIERPAPRFRPLRVGVLCECSGAVRDAFRRLGHDAVSCDLKPTRAPGPHLRGDCRDVDWSDRDLLVMHPDCTYLTSSGLHWNHKRPERAKLTRDALAFVRWMMGLPVEHYALENPVGCIGTEIRPADQTIQPYEFGHDASKRTCLWLKGLPPLVPTRYVEPRMVDGKPRWGNQTDSGQNKLPPSEHRKELRSNTYSGIAQAMAAQWSAAILAAHANAREAPAC